MTPSTVTDYVITLWWNELNITRTIADMVAMTTTTTTTTDSMAVMVVMAAMGDGNHLAEVAVMVAVEEAMVAVAEAKVAEDENLKGIVI